MFDREVLNATGVLGRGGAPSGNSKDVATRQAFGAYYTPLRVAAILTDWAIRDAKETILEPCFGGCDFLEAMQNRFIECGQTMLAEHIFGCDVDLDAFGYLSSRLGTMTRPGNFLHADFLTTTADSFGKTNFDAVIGNPPYIKNDRIGDHQRESIKLLSQHIHQCVKGRANLWAYFIMHAMSFLKVGGRMAWVLPGNFLTADYASSIRTELSKRFKHVIAISVAERLFLSQGTEERTVVLMCDGYQQDEGNAIQIKYCTDSLELKEIISATDLDKKVGVNEHGKFALLTEDQSKAFMEVAGIFQAKSIGEFGAVYIGIVIGDKKFFIRRMSEWKEIPISKSYFVPIVSKFKHLSGLSLKPDDIDRWRENDQESFLLNTRGKRLGSQVRSYLSTNEENNKGDNSTFLRREIWHQPDDGRVADAFIACLNNLGPRMVLNSEKLQATNTLYRFFFKTGLNISFQKMLAISMMTSFSQLSAELNGRQLGSGGLKLEPKGVSNILVATNNIKTEAEISATFKTMDDLIRREKFDEARRTADYFIFGDQLSRVDYENICEGLKRVRAHRLRGKTLDESNTSYSDAARNNVTIMRN
ncbi:MAG: N-6 DNA methylase [Gallionella sp.]|nr:N-6 DNA methylase [Gallionella sp.]